MTLKEFLVELEKTPRKWSFYDHDGAEIRMWHERDNLAPLPTCPITAVALSVTGTMFQTTEWREAAQEIGLPSDTAKTILSAADKADSPFESMRRNLLKACGLEEHAK